MRLCYASAAVSLSVRKRIEILIDNGRIVWLGKMHLNDESCKLIEFDKFSVSIRSNYAIDLSDITDLKLLLVKS